MEAKKPYKVVPGRPGDCWALTRAGKPCQSPGWFSWTDRRSMNFCARQAHMEAYLDWKREQRKQKKKSDE